MTGTERKRAWRERQKQPGQASNGRAPGTGARPDPLREQAKVLKSLRAEIRLKHSLVADEELGLTIPAASRICTQLILRGFSPTLANVKRILAGGALPK